MIPETVIIEMHAVAHRKRDDLAAARLAHEAQKSLADQALRHAINVEHEFREVLAFLAEYNPDACDWWAEYNMKPDRAQGE